MELLVKAAERGFPFRISYGALHLISLSTSPLPLLVSVLNGMIKFHA
jgi:hypothetical protein